MEQIDNTTKKVGKAIQIQSISADGTVWVQNVGDSEVTLADIYINGVKVANPQWSQNTPLSPAQTVSGKMGETFTSGEEVTVKVTTTDGTYIEMTKHFP